MGAVRDADACVRLVASLRAIARSRHATFGGALLAAGLGAVSGEAASPYPQSNRIIGIEWHPESYQGTPEGGDIWPISWAADGSLLTAWGDGVIDCPQKASYGVARIASDQPSVDMASVHCGPGPQGLGKLMSMIAAGDVLYSRFSAQDESSGYPIWKSVNGGVSWTAPSAPLSFYLNSFVQFGRANQGAPGGYVYALEPREAEIRLVRTPANQVQSSASYEYFSGTSVTPSWSLSRSSSKAIFTDLAGTKRPTMTYVPALDRYLLTVSHSKLEDSAAHKIGIFEAPNPWGPWRTVSYVDNFLGMTGGIFYFINFPVKWQADSGTTLWATFSCYSRKASEPCGIFHDRFNLMSATLDVVPEPPPPTAAADEATTNANTPVLVRVLDNDAGSQLDVRFVSTPTNGTSRINTDRTVSYTPKTGFTGSDTFTYVVTDSFEQQAAATVAVSVPNRPPVAVPDSATSAAPASVRVYPLTNDSDPDGHSITIASSTTAGHGTTTLSTDRKSILYKPASGYSGSDSFTYTVSDNRGGTAPGVITVSVANRPPIATPDSIAVIAGKTAKLLVLANDSDPDGHGLKLAQLTPVAHGSATLSTDRKSVSYKSASGYAGPDSFTYTVSDGYGGTAQATVSLQVQNRPPVAVADSVSTAYNTSVRITPLVNDSDADGHGLVIAAVTAPANGTATISTDRKAVVYRSTSGYRGGDSFSYTASDGYGGTAQATVAVTVRPPS